MSKFLIFSFLILLIIFSSCKSTKEKINYNNINWDTMTEPFYNKIQDSLKPLVHIFSLMMNRDQEYRQKNNPSIYYNNYKEQEILDSLNEIELIEIVKKYGWLNAYEAGFKVEEFRYMILQHCSLKTQQAIYPLIRKKALEKKISCIDLMLIEDRINISNRIKQRYGTQLMFNNKTKSYSLYPLLNVDSVNYYRKEAGTKETLEKYLLSSFKINFNREDYFKKLPNLIKVFNFTDSPGVYYKNPLPSFIKIDSTFVKHL